MQDDDSLASTKGSAAERPIVGGTPLQNSKSKLLARTQAILWQKYGVTEGIRSRQVKALIDALDYQHYHDRVVEECVRLMGEQNRQFFDEVCDYIPEYLEGIEPREVALAQQEACT